MESIFLIALANESQNSMRIYLCPCRNKNYADILSKPPRMVDLQSTIKKKKQNKKNFLFFTYMLYICFHKKSMSKL